MKKNKISIIFLLAIIISITNPLQKIYAYNDFYSDNNILFFDEKANPSVSSFSCSPGNTIAEKIWNYFINKNLSKEQTAGIMGNLYQESHLSPTKWQTINEIDKNSIENLTTNDGKSAHAWGIAQWDGSRRYDNDGKTGIVGKILTEKSHLAEYLQSKYSTDGAIISGDSLTSNSPIFNIGIDEKIIDELLMFQLDYIWAELPGNGLGELQKTTTVTDSTVIFHDLFERSADTDEQVKENRVRYSNIFYNQFNNSATNNYSNCTTAAADATWPENVIASNKGWTLKNDTDYSNIACDTNTIDVGIYTHPINGFSIRLCQTETKIISSLISSKFNAMYNAAKQNGIDLAVTSGYRSYEEQIKLRENNCPNAIESSANSCDPPTAKAGFSMHEKGLAVDFTGIGRVGSGPAWDWLVANAQNYGFYNLPSEGWHWSVSGS